MDKLNRSSLNPRFIIKFLVLRKLNLIFLIFGIEILIINGSLGSCGLELQGGWIDFGGPSWFIDNSSEESPTLESGPIETSGVSRICRVVKGPATVSFLWKTDANYHDNGQLDFLVNGERKYVCGSAEGETRSYNLRNHGNYILSWEYIKFKSYPEYLGAGWIKDICIVSDANDSLEASNSSKPIGLQSVNMNKGNDIVYVDHNEDIINNIFSSFNEAIKHVSEGGVVKVNRGNYSENIIINKPLELEGADRNKAIISGAGDIICIGANDVTVSNLTLIGGYRGLNLSNSPNCEIKHNNILNCTKGIELEKSDRSIISENEFLDNEIGICLKNSSYSQINRNNIRGPENVLDYSKGILLAHSNNDVIDFNKLCRYYMGISIQSKSMRNVVTNRNNYSNILASDLYFEMEEADLHESTIHNDKCVINSSCQVFSPNICEDCP